MRQPSPPNDPLSNIERRGSVEFPLDVLERQLEQRACRKAKIVDSVGRAYNISVARDERNMREPADNNARRMEENRLPQPGYLKQNSAKQDGCSDLKSVQVFSRLRKHNRRSWSQLSPQQKGTNTRHIEGGQRHAARE